ncbi:bluetail domain-containing putative surface protein [Synechococcus elongatus]|uniref:DUF4214 domain-containing protein n=2 Tax=Synechococcus elongatus TaxID=32046 RepID=Q31P61_SYNE7|nr:bluetail domain-containing putative surface protein [Synechococcus elongatus]ABB57158.1 conserved hypothetical protein [Synechococcus elongatus PCC 7942 = FACHB-805]AJD58327.1 hypothetical protein M744_11020 [Synechococcus elongatus UTEX 2973]MBD2587559.1 DUF4214 domain-containing protein [Synechococcus elongatus FACHB-242]MBD2688662.1 DUF4214 domain-containing protein [Synechococcus elongatus FACHB-1061]MBD2707733.1 DUF4214 domain-containing protein [Synechococcus elongatus PCC 7942 = FACH
MANLKITSAQQLYVAFYGRPADPAGQKFWDVIVQDNLSTLNYGAIAEAFGESVESFLRFSSLSAAEAVNTLFQTILNRDADPIGQDFYVKELESGRLSLANLAIAIVEGIEEGSRDAQTFLNKVLVADLFTRSLDSLEEIEAYDFSKNPIALPTVQALLAQVTGDDSSLPNALQVTAIAQQVVVSSGSPATAIAISEARSIVKGNDDNQLSSSEAFTLIGTNGNDLLTAGNGDDNLIGELGADTLTGGAGQDQFLYRAIADSQLSGFDQITDFQIGSDRLVGPNSVSATEISNVGTVSSLDPESLVAVLTPDRFMANGAATFQIEQRTFVAFNDDLAGFQAERDLLIEITGFQGDLTSLAIV